MSWLNPIAFVGLLALAVPILVHLFGRRVARRLRFPSLRLLRDARPTPATRSRPSDVLLLALRCLTMAAAVAALAQPRLSRAGEQRAPARVIITDTSVSMQRLTSEGATAVQQARTIASRMIDSSSEALLVETDRPGDALAGAGSWLSRRGGAREVVVISDFQTGSVDEGQLAVVRSGIGARLVRVAAGGSVPANDTIDNVRIEAAADRTSATWVSSGDDSSASVTILAADEDRNAVQASLAAAHSVAPRVPRSTNKVTVVFPGAPARRELLAQITPLDSAWQGDLVLSLQRDPVLASVAKDIVIQQCETAGTVVVRDVLGNPIASVAGTTSGLRVFACVKPGTLVATALIAGVEAALDTPAPMQELEPNFLPDETLRQWERPAIESAPRGPGETSPDGRWIWLIALVFLIAEEFIRRRRPKRSAESVSEVRNERVA